MAKIWRDNVYFINISIKSNVIILNIKSIINTILHRIKSSINFNGHLTWYFIDSFLIVYWQFFLIVFL